MIGNSLSVGLNQSQRLVEFVIVPKPPGNAMTSEYLMNIVLRAKVAEVDAKIHHLFMDGS